MIAHWLWCEGEYKEGPGGRWSLLLKFVPDFGQAIFRQSVVRGEFQSLLEVVARFAIQFLCRINAPEIVMGIMVRLVAPGLQRALKPRNRFVVFALLDQICADVVVGSAKLRIDLNGLLAFRNGIVNLSLEAVGPSQEREGLRRGMKVQQAF